MKFDADVIEGWRKIRHTPKNRLAPLPEGSRLLLSYNNPLLNYSNWKTMISGAAWRPSLWCLLVVLLATLSQPIDGFAVVHPTRSFRQTSSQTQTASSEVLMKHLSCNKSVVLQIPLQSRSNENSDDDVPDSGELQTSDNNFDGEGFAKYLAPYAVALLGSIVATYAMFKFVLMDY